MQITLLGIVLVPLSLYWAANPLRLLQLALVFAVFEAAAALVIGGSFGLQPGMMPGLLFVTYIAAQYALGMRYAGESLVIKSMSPLLGLLFYAVVSAWLLPDTFAGVILVSPQKQDVFTPSLVPLEFSFGNVTQSLYLAINITFGVAVAIFLTRRSLRYGSLIKAYMIGGYVVVSLSIWQLGNRLSGLPFPNELLHSNPGWAIVEQSIGAMPRIQGPFTEPAGLALYLSGLTFCCLWLSLRGYRVMAPRVLLTLSIISMLLSTSTTGLAVLSVGMPLMVVAASIADPLARGRAVRLAGLLLLGFLAALGLLLLIKPELMEVLGTVIETTFAKGDSDSYIARTGVDAAAFATVAETYGLGVGWGSFRSSSLLPGLLANAGVLGVALVLGMIIRFIILRRRGLSVSRRHPGQILVGGFTASLCGQFAAALLSVPMLTSLAFFLQLGSVVGVLARILVESERPRNTKLGAAARLDHPSSCSVL